MNPRSDMTLVLVPCDAEHRCGHCHDCRIDDEDDDAPTAAELREHDRLEYERCVRASLRDW